MTSAAPTPSTKKTPDAGQGIEGQDQNIYEGEPIHMNATEIIAQTTDIPTAIVVPAGSFPFDMKSVVIVDRDGHRAIDGSGAVFVQVFSGELQAGSTLADGATFVGEYTLADSDDADEQALVLLSKRPCTIYPWCTGHNVITGNNRHDDAGRVIESGPIVMHIHQVVDHGEATWEWWFADMEVQRASLEDLVDLRENMAKAAERALSIARDSEDAAPTAHNAGNTEITHGWSDTVINETVVIYMESEDGTTSIVDHMSPEDARRHARTLLEQAERIDENAGN